MCNLAAGFQHLGGKYRHYNKDAEYFAESLVIEDHNTTKKSRKFTPKKNSQ
jgi:hypothetical protein